MSREERRALMLCRHRLGVRGKKGKIFAAVASALGVPKPDHKQAGYALCCRFVGAQSVPQRPRPVAGTVDVTSDEFLSTYEWRRLRMEVIVERGNRCECCGATPQDGIRINVDHIKPRRKFPHLALEKSNLQILCEDCNHGKGNWNQTDWRAPQPEPQPARPVLNTVADSVHFAVVDQEQINELRNGKDLRPRLVRRTAS